MYKITMSLDTKDIEQVIKQLTVKERQKLIQKLVEEDFDTAVNKLRRNVKERGLSTEKINQIVIKARRQYYDKSRH